MQLTVDDLRALLALAREDGTMSHETPDYSLLMPFVVVASAGGPYDDGAFVAGCRFGTWDALLTLKPVMHAEYEPPELVPQLDLLAMHHGYTMTTEPFDDDWIYVEMRRNGTVPQEGQADE